MHTFGFRMHLWVHYSSENVISFANCTLPRCGSTRITYWIQNYSNSGIVTLWLLAGRRATQVTRYKEKESSQSGIAAMMKERFVVFCELYYIANYMVIERLTVEPGISTIFLKNVMNGNHMSRLVALWCVPNLLIFHFHAVNWQQINPITHETRYIVNDGQYQVIIIVNNGDGRNCVLHRVIVIVIVVAGWRKWIK